MILGMTYYQICMYFLIYSFLGWCVEVVYHALKNGQIVNRGFLNGPVCPVYGFGMLAVIAMVNILPKDQTAQEPNLWLVFLGGMILTTLIELAAGFLLYHCFHARWWDYSKMPGNIGGYICPLFSILWGMACVLVIKLVHPVTQHISDVMIPEQYGWPVMLVLYIIYFIDFIATVLTVAGFNKKLKKLNELDQKLRMVSNDLSEVLGEETIKTTEKVEEGSVQAALAKADLKDKVKESADEMKLHHELAEAVREEQTQKEKRIALQKREETMRQDLISHKHFGTGRLLKAFPDMKHRDYESLVNELKALQKSKERS